MAVAVEAPARICTNDVVIAVSAAGTGVGVTLGVGVGTGVAVGVPAGRAVDDGARKGVSAGRSTMTLRCPKAMVASAKPVATSERTKTPIKTKPARCI